MNPAKKQELRDQRDAVLRDVEEARARNDWPTVDMLRGLLRRLDAALQNSTWVHSLNKGPSPRLCHGPR